MSRTLTGCADQKISAGFVVAGGVSCFVGELEIFRKCIANNRIDLEVEVRAYDLYPPEDMIFRDFVVSE